MVSLIGCLGAFGSRCCELRVAFLGQGGGGLKLRLRLAGLAFSLFQN